jgi:hypothetical protein
MQVTDPELDEEEKFELENILFEKYEARIKADIEEYKRKLRLEDQQSTDTEFQSTPGK